MSESLEGILQKIKADYEAAVKARGTEGLHALIRSHGVINHLHEYVKRELIRKGIASSKIYPPVNTTSPEISMIGYLKRKKQDISVLANPPVNPGAERVADGVLAGTVDNVGLSNMNSSISINVRSQLSSLAKNFDTLFERTFAEPLNLHLRANNLVMGEVYMVPLIAYDDREAKNKRIAWRELLPVRLYVPAFRMLNLRKGNREPYKYERLALLVVDFREDTPKVITDADAFVEEGIITEAEKESFSLKDMTMDSFIQDLLQVYSERNHGLKKLQ